MQLGKLGVWTFLDAMAADEAATFTRRVESWGYSALWIPEAVGRDPFAFLVCELLEGSAVDELIRGSPLPLDRALDVAVQVADALAAAHRRGIVHGNVKPSNVFITVDGVVKLLDFGIAKLADVSLTGPASRPLGTVAYMSPEQAHGTRVDHRTDLWSVGAVLYEMLSGRRPYPRGVPGATADARSSLPPSLTAERPDVPPALERVVLKALERFPADRFTSADAFAQALLPAVAAT